MLPRGVSKISQTQVLCRAESRDEEGLPRWLEAGRELSILGSCQSPCAERHGGVQEPGMLGTIKVRRKGQQGEWGPEGSQAFIL